MIGKLFVVGCLLLLLVSGITFICQNNQGVNKLKEKQYQGPVPIGYNLEHFRETGETIKEVVE